MGTATVGGGTDISKDVAITSALPAGTNNIGDMDVLSVIPGTGVTNLGKAGNSLPNAGDTAIPALAVRKDTAAPTALVNQLYGPLTTDAVGRLWIHPNVDIASALPAGTNNIGDVDVATLPATPAGTNYIGRTGKRRVRIAVKPTITAGAYAVNDAVGGLLEFANAAAESGIGGRIVSAVVVDDKGQGAANDLVLFLFDRTFTPTADNAPLAISEGDAENTAGQVTFLASNVQVINGAQPIHLYAENDPGHGFVLLGTSLFGQLKCKGTPTYAATDDLTVILTTEQD